jgi:hypothetical protein
VFRENGFLQQSRGMRVVKAAVSRGTRLFLLVANWSVVLVHVRCRAGVMCRCNVWSHRLTGL